VVQLQQTVIPRTHRISVVLLWGLILLTFVGSLPRIGCLCADGRQKLFCCGASDRCCALLGHRADSLEPRSCCRKGSSVASASPVGTKAGGCPHCGRNGSRRPAPVSLSSRGCVPLVGIPLLPPVETSVAPTAAAIQSLWIEPIDRAEPAIAVPQGRATRNRHLPIPDRLIAHQVFLI
jgi:hypothetical protein